MKIPPKYQVFAEPVTITDKDQARLTPHLGSWMQVHALMKVGVNEPDLRRLVVLELMDKRRRMILLRLTGRIAFDQLRGVRERIDEVLK